MSATPALTWGPRYWFFLHSLAETYPQHPTVITKRKYYDVIQNFPLFMPDKEMGDRFAEMLQSYPLSPYLVSRESFRRWVWFVHNKVNVHIGKPPISREEADDARIQLFREKHAKVYEHSIPEKVQYVLIGAAAGAAAILATAALLP